MKIVSGTISVLVLGLLLATVIATPVNTDVAPLGTPTFTFGVAGDIGWNESGAKSKVMLSALKADLSNLSFFLAAGDLSYSTIAGTEPQWCSYVKSYVGSSFPFQVLGADHEDNRSVTRIDKFAACLPDKMGSTGQYGKESYFDFPAGAPLARIISISPGMYLPTKWEYKANDTHFQWTMKAIDGARAVGIPWVIVAAHLPCISTLSGTKSCPGQVDLFNALLVKKVDLIIHGDHHSYQRTNQLRCAILNAGIYFPECIVDRDGAFVKGSGSVVAICGTGGRGLSKVDRNDGDNQYFATAMGSNTAGFGWGYLRVTVTATTLTATTRLSGTYSDSFSIGG